MLVRTARDSSLPGRFRRDPEKVFEGLEMTEQVREELLTNIRRRLTPQPVKIRAGTWRDRVTAVATHASRRALTLLSTFALGGPRPPDIELTCFTYEGIDGLVAAIRAGEAASTEDIQIKVDGDKVSISAEVRSEREVKNGDAKDGERVVHTERQYGKVARSFSLGQDVDSARAEAKFADGVLVLTLPKKAAESTRQITIQ